MGALIKSQNEHAVVLFQIFRPPLYAAPANIIPTLRDCMGNLGPPTTSESAIGIYQCLYSHFKKMKIICKNQDCQLSNKSVPLHQNP